MDEMNAILKLYPELSKTVKLKIYDSQFEYKHLDINSKNNN